MDQLICASLSRTHYWYEVGMLKVPAVHITYKKSTVQQSIFDISFEFEIRAGTLPGGHTMDTSYSSMLPNSCATHSSLQNKVPIIITP